MQQHSPTRSQGVLRPVEVNQQNNEGSAAGLSAGGKTSTYGHRVAIVSALLRRYPSHGRNRIHASIPPLPTAFTLLDTLLILTMIYISQAPAPSRLLCAPLPLCLFCLATRITTIEDYYFSESRLQVVVDRDNEWTAAVADAEYLIDASVE